MGVMDRVNNFISDAGDTARDLGRQIDDWSKPLALSYFVSPLIAQDIAGAAFSGALSRGADPRAAFQQAALSPATLVGGGDTQQWADLASFNAAIAVGAAGGAFAAAPSAFSGTALGVIPFEGTVAGMGAVGSVGVGLAAGAGTYALTQSWANREGGGDLDAATASDQPTQAQMAANDPDTSAQFQRLRKAARMLGRAGTFRGGKTLGGPEGSLLGEQLSLTGT
jgi:hypothetical protein